MADSRFPSPGTDTRFDPPGTDTRFSTPGTDARFPAPGQDTRFDGAAPPPADPPVNTKTPTLALSPDNQTLLYGSGIWIGTPPLTITARLFVDDIDTAPAAPSMPVLPAWQGKECGIREAATNAAGGPVYALSPEVLVPVPPSLDAQVQAILAGREGTVFDLGDNATRFTDSAATVPVTANGQAVQAVKSKWGTLAYTFSTANVANAPLAEADAVLFDGVDDVLLGGVPSRGFLNNTPAVSVGISFKPATVGTGNGTLLFLSRSTGTGINWLDFLRSTSTLRFLSKRSGGDANAIFTSAVGTLAVGQQADALLESDFAGTGRMETWLDGNQLAGVDLGGTLGNSEALNSAGTALGAVSAASSRFFGSIRKVFLARFKLTPEEKATVQAWLEEA
jgi:hypothetical protein